MFSDKLKHLSDHRELYKELINPANYQYRQNSVQGKLKMLSAPLTVKKILQCGCQHSKKHELQ